MVEGLAVAEQLKQEDLIEKATVERWRNHEYIPETIADKSRTVFQRMEPRIGWKGLPGYWQVRGGAIVGAPANGVKAHTFLGSQKKYKDFELRFQVRRKNGVGDSGVQIRSQIKDTQSQQVIGPQIQIGAGDDSRITIRAHSAPFRQRPAYPSLLKVVAVNWKDDDFNEMHIRCVGKHVTVRLSGVIVLDVDYPTIPDDGIIAWQLHGGVPPEEITFKDIQFAKPLTRRLACRYAWHRQLSFSSAVCKKFQRTMTFVAALLWQKLAGWKTHPRTRELARPGRHNRQLQNQPK